MAPAFKQLAGSLRSRVNVIEVDCEKYSATCRTYRIQSFPTLRMYNEGEATEYHGGRNHDAMQRWALKAGAGHGLPEIDDRELGDRAREQDVLFLYLHTAGTPQREMVSARRACASSTELIPCPALQEAVAHASRVLLTTPAHLYRSSSQLLLDRYKARLTQGSSTPGAGAAEALSGLLVFKDGNLVRPADAFYPSRLAAGLSLEQSSDEVGAWLTEQRFASVTEVTGTTFSEVMESEYGSRVMHMRRR
jgi:protein disulfide-isomerase